MTNQTSWYVYGIVDSDVSADELPAGVGDPPSAVEVVSSGSIASLASKVPTDRPLGTTDDLLAHQRVLDEAAVVSPVLPVRFGAVVDSREAITDELLGPNEDTLADLLAELDGQVQYVVRARYNEDAILREILEENPAAMRLREEIQGQPAELTRDAQLKLGELINAAVERKREADIERTVDLLAPCTTETSQRQPSHELDAANIAMLVPLDGQDDMTQAISELAGMWQGRATIRLLGPMAPYDFVALPAPDEQPPGALAA